MKSLSKLFPYPLAEKKHPFMKKCLEEYQFLLNNTLNALQSFKEKDFEKFDALVGENACQIRSIKIATMTRTYQPDILLNKVLHVSKTIEELLRPDKIRRFMNQCALVIDVFQQYDLDIPITADDAFLIQSFILCEMKQRHEYLTSLMAREKCAPKMIQMKYPHIGFVFLDKLATHLRTNLSIASVNFVKDIGKISDDVTMEHNGLHCIPAFLQFKTLFPYAIKQQLPILLRVKFARNTDLGFEIYGDDYLFYSPCSLTNTYLLTQLGLEDLYLPTCIIEGTACLENKHHWKTQFTKHSLLDILYATAAHHRQYPNPEKKLHHEELESYYTFAEQKGFSLTNPSTFFAQHIYCAQPIRIIQ